MHLTNYAGSSRTEISPKLDKFDIIAVLISGVEDGSGGKGFRLPESSVAGLFAVEGGVPVEARTVA